MVNLAWNAAVGLSALVSLVKALPRSEAEAFQLFRRQSPELADCLQEKGVPVSFKWSSDFEDLAEPFNLRLQYTPAAIALPEIPQHVQDAVRCAAKTGTKVQAKSGGHSYASYSSGGQDGSLVVSLERLQEISLDKATGIAKVGGGVRLGNLALGIFEQGERGLPHGTCPGVGIGGHFTHGGYGYSSRYWGLAMDNIVGLDVVLADGSYVYASGTSNPDLYFALRGAADSFGIITTFHVQTHPAPDTVVQFSFYLPNMLESVEIATDSFLHLQDFARNPSFVDRRLSFGMYMDGRALSISGIFAGGLDDFNERILPEFLAGLPEPEVVEVNERDWISSLTVLSGADTLEVPLQGYDEHDTFYAKSIVTQESRPLSREALESFFSFVINQGRNAPSAWFTIINLYGGPDSQITVQPRFPDAYAHRNSLWVFQNYASSSLPFNSDILTFVDDLTRSVTDAQPDGEFAAYLNYLDPALSPPDAHRLYYGPDLYARLLELKGEYDPQSVFWNPQAIGTS